MRKGALRSGDRDAKRRPTPSGSFSAAAAGIAIDAGGTVYFVDVLNNVIRTLRPERLPRSGPGLRRELPADRVAIMRSLEPEGQLQQVPVIVGEPEWLVHHGLDVLGRPESLHNATLRVTHDTL